MRVHSIPAPTLLLSLVLVGALAARAEEPATGLPPGLEVELEGTYRQTADGDVEFSGPVSLTYRDARIQADRLVLRGQRHIEVEGNVLIVWGKNRLFGSRGEYDLETGRGTFYDVMGEVLNEYLFWADQVEKIGEDKLRLKRATVTTCTQPLPYWSFAVSSATIRIEKYARMWNVRLRASRVPVFYLPYLVWPVKEGRAAGLLMPEFFTSQDRGRVISQELFIPLGRSADLTLVGRHFSDAGFGGGGELRWVPNREGSLRVNGFYINDSVAAENQRNQPNNPQLPDPERYRVTYEQSQKFLNGFRMLADINDVSDDQFYGDFERDLDIAASPTVLARLEFSRNGPSTSLNVREWRREQLSSGLVQQTLPEIELRGNSRRLGKTPLYLSFESSAASIQQDGPGIDADYLRADVFPTLSAPFSPLSWLDITPRVSYRVTHWTQRCESSDGIRCASGDRIADSSITRQVSQASLQLVGPKFFRIFGSGGERARYKHTFEPNVSYRIGGSFDEQEDIITFDSIDPFSLAGNSVTYGLVQKLFTRRPRSKPLPSPPGGELVVLPDGTEAAADGEPDTAADEAPEPTHEEPVEIASLELAQSRSFETDVFLSTGIVDAGGTRDDSSYSPIVLTGRYNPSSAISTDLRATWDIVFNNIRDATLSGTMRNRLASIRFSMVHQNGLGFSSSGQRLEDSTQVRLNTGFSFYREKLQFNVDGLYDADPSPGGVNFPEQRYRLQYTSQCCTILVERLTRDFPSSDDRRELHFRVDLRGVGKLLRHTF